MDEREITMVKLSFVLKGYLYKPSTEVKRINIAKGGLYASFDDIDILDENNYPIIRPPVV